MLRLPCKRIEFKFLRRKHADRNYENFLGNRVINVNGDCVFDCGRFDMLKDALRSELDLNDNESVLNDTALPSPYELLVALPHVRTAGIESMKVGSFDVWDFAGQAEFYPGLNFIFIIF